MIDPYDIIGVARDANTASIKAAYRRRAKTAHPDSGGDVETFARLKAAYELLLDPRVGLDTDGVVPRLAGGPHERAGAAPDVEQPPVTRQASHQGRDRTGAQAGEAACVGVRHACPECFRHEARP